MKRQLKDKGYLLIDDLTIPVLYYKDDYGATLKLRPLHRQVLGKWLSVESGKIKHSPPALLSRLLKGDIVNL